MRSLASLPPGAAAVPCHESKALVVIGQRDKKPPRCSAPPLQPLSHVCNRSCAIEDGKTPIVLDDYLIDPKLSPLGKNAVALFEPRLIEDICLVPEPDSCNAACAVDVLAYSTLREFILLSTLFLKCWLALQPRFGILGAPTLVSWDDPSNSPCGRRLAFCV